MKRSFQRRVSSGTTRAAVAACIAAAGLVGCNRDSTLGEQPTIRGQVVDPFTGTWAYGSGFNMNLELEDQASSRTVLASSPIDGQGNFAITLPPLSRFESYLQEHSANPYTVAASCSNTVTANTLPARSISAHFVAARGAVGYAILPVMLDRGSFEKATRVTYYHHVYSDREFSLDGKISCPRGDGPASTTVHESYGSGWNVFADTYASLDTPHPTRATANFPVPDGVKWYPIR